MLNKTTQYLNPRNVKLALLAVMVMTLLYLVLVQGCRNVSADRGERAIEGIDLTAQQAESMTQTTEDVSVLIEDTITSPAPAPVSEDAIATPGAQRPEISTEATQAWYVTRIDELTRRWTPRYEAAIRDIDTFESRFNTAASRLTEYFDQQSDLTDSIANPSLRSELVIRDQQERNAYGRWLRDGELMVLQALKIREELTDMDTVLRKQQLTASMLSEFSQISSIPASAQSLHASLGSFRSQSDQLASDLSDRVFTE